MSAKKGFPVLAILVMGSMIVSACRAPATPRVVEKVVTQVVRETQVVEKVVTQVVRQTQVVTQVVAAEDYSAPDPILSDVRVRQAIALCTNREEAIKAVYPFETDQKALLMDSFLPKTHWAYGGPYQPDLAYNPDNGKALLDQAGWKLAKPDDTYRTNTDGETLTLKLTTTDVPFRRAWSAVVEQSLLGCGIQLLRNFVPSPWWFASTSGLRRRDFQLGAYAWLGDADRKGQMLYACDQIPLPSNDWVGSNYMGWCNEAASDAIIAANNTLNKDKRLKLLNIVQQEFVKDVVSLPMFSRLEGEAWGNSFLGLKPDPTEYGTASVDQWSLKNAKTSLVIAFSHEPASLYAITDPSSVQREVNDLVFGRGYTQFSYGYQPWLFELSTLDDELATNNLVDVRAGDTVWNTDNRPEKLAKGTRIILEGEELTYDGDGILQLPQLIVTYKMKNTLTWSDGQASGGRRPGAGLQAGLQRGIWRARSHNLRRDAASRIQRYGRGGNLLAGLPGPPVLPWTRVLNLPGAYGAEGRPQAGRRAGQGMVDPTGDRREADGLRSLRVDRMEQGPEPQAEGEPELQASPEDQGHHDRDHRGHQPGQGATAERQGGLAGEGQPGRGFWRPDRCL